MKKKMLQLNMAWRKFVSSSLLEKCSMLSFLCICVFFVDCCIFGGGRYIMIGPLSPRMILAFLAVLFAVPELLRNLRGYIRNPSILLTGIFVIYFAICAVRGYLAGNRMDVLLSDVKGFCWLFLVPVLISTVRSKERLERLLTCILTGALLQALCVIIINAVCVLNPGYDKPICNAMITMLIGNVDAVSESIFRVFIKSVPYLAVGCGIVVFRQIREKYIRKRYVLMMAILLNAMLFSYTRSVYGCFVVVFLCAAAAILLFYRSDCKLFFRFCVVSILVTLALVIIQEFCLGGSYLNFALSRTFGMEPAESIMVKLRNQLVSSEATTELEGMGYYASLTVESDNLRALTQSELYQLIQKNPVFGNGLGAAVPSRSSGLDEYFYLDVLTRMGVVGLVLYVLPFAYVVLFCLRNWKGISQFHSGCAVLCGLMGFWAISWFNPWMNAVLGIAMYAVCTTLPGILQVGKHNQSI